MTTIGYATLDVIPSLKGAQASLERQAAGPMAAAGKSGGTKYGAAAGTAAGSSFKSKFQSGLKNVAAPLVGAFAAVGAVRWAGATFDALKRIETINAQTASAIQATGGAANASAGEVEALAGRLETLTATEAESVQEGANLLLTFRNIKNEAGAGNDIFDQATVAMVDMARAMGTDASGGAIQLGKALNDPVKGMAALTRVGVQFTEQQRTMIEGFVEQGDMMSAQKVILAELNDQFGGAGAAFAETTQGKIDLAVHKFGELSEELLSRTLPAAAALAEGFTNQVAPALVAGGEAVADIAGLFRSLPAPVQAAAGAFAALKLSSMIGLTGLLTGGATRLSGAMDSLRIRAMLTSDAFTASRASGGRLPAVFSGIRAGAAGAAGALRGFVAAAIPIAALTLGITLLTKFKQAQEESRQRVEEHTAALDAQTGALTAANEEIAFNALLQSGAIDAARELGVNFDDLRNAALGNEDAMARVNAVLEQYGKSEAAATTGRGAAIVASDAQVIAANKVRDAIGGQNDEVNRASQVFKDQAAFMGDASDATDDAAGSMRTYKTDLDKTTGALKRLREEEEGRRLDNIQERRDWIALRETLRAAREEARNGKQVLGDQTKAADTNMSALLDLADQWNNSTTKVRQSRGAYEDMRQKFIEIADQMNGPNGTRQDAIKLADSLLTLPKNVDIKFRSEGYQERMAELQALRQAARDLVVQLDYQGLVKAAGTGENPGAQKPPTTNEKAVPGGVTVNVGKVYANNTDDLVGTAQRRAGGGF